MARRAGMVDVELVEETTGEPAGPRRDLTPWLRLALGAATVLVVVLALAHGATTRAERQDEARLASLAAVAGLVPSLREPVAEQWRATGQLTLVGGLALSTQADAGTVARDAATGESRWETPDPLSCPTTLTDGAVTVCEVRDRPRLDLRDSATGALLGVVDLPGGLIGWHALGADLVVARRDAGRILVERTDPLRGDVAWRSEVAGTHDLVARQLTMHVENGFVAVEGPLAAVLDATDGTTLAVRSAGPWNIVADPLRVTSDPLGFTLWEPWGGTWYDRSGGAGPLTAGRPVSPAIDDGSAGQVALARSGDVVRAVDRDDGTPRWSSAQTGRAQLRLEDRLVVRGEGLVRALSLLTGEDLWSVEVSSDAGTMVTDGVRVLLVTPGPPGGPDRLTAHTLEDGTPVWSIEMPAGTSSVGMEDSTIVARGEGVAVILS